MYILNQIIPARKHDNMEPACVTPILNDPYSLSENKMTTVPIKICYLIKFGFIQILNQLQLHKGFDPIVLTLSIHAVSSQSTVKKICCFKLQLSVES